MARLAIMQVIIVKTNCDGQETREVIENVTNLSAAFNHNVTVDFKDDNGRSKTQFIKLDGYTELIVR